MRNFVLGPFLSLCSGVERGLVLHPIPQTDLAKYRDGNGDHLTWQPFSSYEEGALAGLLRYSLAYAQMYWADTQSMRYGRQAKISGSIPRHLLMRSARMLGRLLSSPRGIKSLDRWHCKVVSRVPTVAEYKDLFSRLGSTVLFCSHQRPLEILAPVLAARELGIPTACFIFSWDNLTSKGRIAAPFDHYFVWSELMRDELLKYYPDVTPDRIHIVGTPQFDPYSDLRLEMTRAEFFALFGADPQRKLICYSGGDEGTCPEDPDHAAILMELIRSGKIRGNPQVLVRPSPVDDGKRYARLRSRFPEMIFAQPAWIHTVPGNWARCIPTSDDIRFLANLTRHADVGVNLASTMTLDFAIHDRPVVNVAFDVNNPPLFGRPPLWDYYYKFEHYRVVVALKAARFARSREQLAEFVNDYLENPALERVERKNFVKTEVGQPIGQSSDIILRTLQRLSNG